MSTRTADPTLPFDAGGRVRAQAFIDAGPMWARRIVARMAAQEREATGAARPTLLHAGTPELAAAGR